MRALLCLRSGDYVRLEAVRRVCLPEVKPCRGGSSPVEVYRRVRLDRVMKMRRRYME